MGQHTIVVCVCLAALICLTSAQSGTWTSVAYVSGSFCTWTDAGETACAGTHYSATFEERGGEIRLQYEDFTPAGTCTTTEIELALLGGLGCGSETYTIDISLNDQLASSPFVVPDTYTAECGCGVVDALTVDGLLESEEVAEAYASSGINELMLSPQPMNASLATFCAVEVRGSYTCHPESCQVCDEEGVCETREEAGCCTSDQDCTEALEGSAGDSCIIAHCDQTEQLCASEWICDTPSTPPVLPHCNSEADCTTLDSYCAVTSCDGTCLIDPIIPLQPGCCNVDSDCQPTRCTHAACDYLRHLCVYKQIAGCATASPTPSASHSATVSATASASSSSSRSPSNSGAPSQTASSSSSATVSVTQSVTLTPSRSPSSSRNVTDSQEASTFLPPSANEVPGSSYELSLPPNDKGIGMGWIVGGVIFASSIVTLLLAALGGYAFYRYRNRTTFIYPEDYIEDEEFPM